MVKKYGEFLFKFKYYSTLGEPMKSASSIFLL